MAGIDTGTRGTYYFHAFESHKNSYIGAAQPSTVTTTINYVYDPLYRLKEANYSDGRYFHYTYDAVGNRLTEEKCAVLPCGTPITNTYVYDIANRLTSVNGQTYQWDDNGNLLDDGTSTYAYDAANRLTSVSGQSSVSSYQYNGLGDRVSQTVDSVTTNYVLDMNAGLTQVLSDGTNTYLYGNGRIGELQPGGFAYHLGDALGSVRQLTDASGAVTLARSFEPYGTPLSSAGAGTTTFAFTGESLDASTGLTFLRARYLSSVTGRFLTRDEWEGDPLLPLSLHRYIYSHDNPVLLTDPSGHCVDPVSCAVAVGVVVLVAFVVSGCTDAQSAQATQAAQATQNAQTILASTIGLITFDKPQSPTTTLVDFKNRNIIGTGFLSLATYLSSGEVFTHAHFTAAGSPELTRAAEVWIVDSTGRVITRVKGSDFQKGNAISLVYGFYTLRSVNLGGMGVKGATLSNSSGIGKGDSIIIVRWALSAGALPDPTGGITTVSDVIVDTGGPSDGYPHSRAWTYAITADGDSGGGLWRNGVVVGNLRAVGKDFSTGKSISIYELYP